MSDLVGNLEDRFSHNEAQIKGTTGTDQTGSEHFVDFFHATLFLMLQVGGIYGDLEWNV